MNRNSTDAAKSRYVHGGLTDRYANRLGWWERKQLVGHSTDFNFTLKGKHSLRPDLVAAEVYGNSNLMWLVLQYNNIVDVNTEFVLGQTIVLPDPRRVYGGLLNSRTGGNKI